MSTFSIIEIRKNPLILNFIFLEDPLLSNFLILEEKISCIGPSEVVLGGNTV